MSLLFPAYLLALLGLTLPWLLHRFSDHRPEEQLFPSRRFLQETAPPVSRKRRLKYLSLFVLRVLSLLLLCFLFAQPWLNSGNETVSARQHHLIAIDQSFSMRANERWAQAMQKAQELLGDLPATDSVELLVFDQSVKLISHSDDSRNELSNALTDMQPGYLSADYGVVMQRINSIAAEQSLPVKLWMISDAQHSALPAQLNALYAPQLSAFELVSLSSDNDFNVHLSARAQSPDGVNVRLSAQIYTSVGLQANSAGKPPERATIEVSHQNRVLVRKQVSLVAGRLETVVFDELTLPSGRKPEFNVALKVGQSGNERFEDAIAIDNDTTVIVENADPTPVTLLQSDANTSSSAAVFLSTALETGGLATVSPISGTAERVSPETAHIVTARDLTQGKIDSDVLLFVDQGRNALVFNSKTVVHKNTDELTGRELGVVDESHPLALGDIDWFGTYFYDLSPIELSKHDRVLLMTSEQEAILVERLSPRGKLLILNDRLDGVASNLPLQPAFVALLQSIQRYFDASSSMPASLIVGQRLPLPHNVQLLNSEQQPLLSNDASSQLTSVQLNEPGLYTVVSARGEQTINVVIDPREADLSAIGKSELDAWQERYNPDNSDNQPSAPDADLQALDRAKNSQQFTLWKLLLPLLVIILMLESWFANQRLDIRRDGS